MKVLIVPDKFKGTLSARKVASAIAEGWHEARPLDELDLAPMSDGGDGFGELLGEQLGGVIQVCETIDAAGREVSSNWWWIEGTQTAVVEAALTNGIALLPPHHFHPFDLDTYGLGAVLKSAKNKGAEQLLIGIGGSATNDAGFGLARALGWGFLDVQGDVIEKWIHLNQLNEVRPSGGEPFFESVMVAVDVKNPLLGEQGCSRVFGPQKGLLDEEMVTAEAALDRLRKVIREQTGNDASMDEGAGAAGGLGYGLATFLNGKFESGFDLFATHTRLKQRIAQADLVITAEGSIDASSMMGKGVFEVATCADERGVPCIGIAGRIADRERVESKFKHLEGIVDSLATVEEAMAEPESWLKKLAFTLGSKDHFIS
ncbi:glycerate kinase [Verrucomicrobia bacterium]|nr:glycerate kinase [Verrucomicrobiota bacterium]